MRKIVDDLANTVVLGSTTGIDDGESEANLNEQARRYKRAMEWLISVDPLTPGKKRVELYREKQREYTEAFEKKVKAFSEALDLARKDPRNKTVEEQREAYDKWVLENHKTYRNLCQAAYMDWVTVGKKEETEYWFSIVDNDSAMSRVEASKVSISLPADDYKIHVANNLDRRLCGTP